MIKSFIVDLATYEVQSGGVELVDAWRSDDNKMLWLDIHNEDSQTETELLTSFEIHPLAMQDAFRPRHPPKIEAFDNFVFFLLRGLDAASLSGGLNFATIQLSLFVGERWVVSRHVKASSTVEWLSNEILKNPKQFTDRGALGLSLQIVNRLVRRYVEILLSFEPRLEEIEEEMFAKPHDGLLEELTNYKSRLREINRISRYHLLLIDELQGQEFAADVSELTHEAKDLFEQVERTGSLASLYYDTCKDLTDGYLALSSHNLNRVMQVLTIITVIFVPLTFIAGIYGMNFAYIPELGIRSGYFVVIGSMFTIAIVLLFMFRRRGWI